MKATVSLCAGGSGKYTARLQSAVNVEIEFGVTKLPQFDVPEGYDSWGYLNKLCTDGMKERYPEDDGTLQKRLEYELGIIKRMGYVDYFLIVWDFIHYAREHGIHGRTWTWICGGKHRFLLPGYHEY